MVDVNGLNFDGSTQLDLSGEKRQSFSPDGKRSSLLGGTTGSPMGGALHQQILGGPAANIASGASKGQGGMAGGSLGVADLLPMKRQGADASAKTADMLPLKQGNKEAKAGDQLGSQESDSFYKMYNKEIKVNQDEIPIILAELTDASYNFITRENYEKALILLQKTEGVLEVVSLEGCTRDKYVSFITYNNMSMCYQKIGMLEECIFYLKQSIALISDPKFYKSKRISMRNKRLNQECKLKLQLCAILSQNQNHSEALENARKSVRLSHLMFKDIEELCQLYIDKINYRDNLLAAQEQSDLEDTERLQLIQMVLESSPAKELPKNFLEQSISLVERSSLKMYPVIREVRRRLVNSEIPPAKEEKPANRRNEHDFQGGDLSSEKGPQEGDEDLEEEKPDMRSVLGFLNQNEWIYNLNIGNIMQIQSIAMKDFLQEANDELELSRDSFLSKLSVLIVTYFCVSTEMRFLLQCRAQYLKPEVKRDRELESEFWHAKALEIACTFLPSECPLLNHVLLSYQKHHDPTMQPIKEDEESQDILSVLRPLKGIQQSKYQPIIRTLPQVKVAMTPDSARLNLKEMLKQLDSDLIEQVLTVHSSKVRKIAKIEDRGVQAVPEVPEINDYSPTQANLSAIVLQGGVKDSFGNNLIGDSSELIGGAENNNILPLSLNDSRNSRNQAGNSMALSGGGSHQTSTQKLQKEMYLQEQSLLDGDFGNNQSGIEGLEQQLMAAVESPQRNNNGNQEDNQAQEDAFQFAIRDNALAAMGEELGSADDELDSNMYDVIISKVLSNPKIDKRTLLQKFISRMEMESNIHSGGLSNELSQIKQMIDQEPSDADKIMKGGNKNHSISQVEQLGPSLVHDMQRSGAQSMQQINVTTGLENQEQDSEVDLKVPSEIVQGQVGVQETRPSREQRRMRAQKPSSAKPANSKDVQNKSTRMDTSARTRSSSHHMKGSGTKHSMAGHSRRIPNAKVSESKDFRKVKSYLEEESLFRDIERSTEYQDPLNLNVMEQSQNTESVPVDVEEIQFEQRSSQKESQSRSNSRKKGPQHTSSIQSSDMHHRADNKDSNQKSFTASRPLTSMTNATRHSSVNLKRGRRRHHQQNAQNQGQMPNQHPQKTLVAKELDDPRNARSESSSRGRYSKLQAKYSSQQTAEPKDQSINNPILSKNQGQQQSQQRLRHSQARKRLSVNHHNMNNVSHGQSVEHHPSQLNESKMLNRVTQKRLGANRHHNSSVQAQPNSQQPPQHHMTSKIKKLVLKQPIEPNVKRQNKTVKQKLSQTKSMVQQNRMSSTNQEVSGRRGRSTRQRKNITKSKSKSKSVSRSSGQRTYSGSSKHRIKSRSNPRSNSDNRKNLYNELAQYSFDLIDGDQVNINAASAQQLIAQHSKTDLQRQVLENQKTILGLLSKQRTSSNDSRKSRSQSRKKSQQFQGLAHIQDLLPKKQITQLKHTISNQQHQSQSMSMSSQARLLMQAKALSSQQHLLEPNLKMGSNHTQILEASHDIDAAEAMLEARTRSRGAMGMQNSASQHVQGLSNFNKQINQSKRNDPQVNKSLQYLKKQQKVAVSKGPSYPPRSKVNVAKKNRDQLQQQQQQPKAICQNEFKQSLMQEIRHLQGRLQEHLIKAKEQSPIRERSGSNKRSGDERGGTRSRSRSPTLPMKALIPKKKSFGQLMAHSKNMNFTTNEIGQQFNESLLNMSSGEQVKPPSRAHATSKLAKRKVENLLHQVPNVDQVVYNSFDEPLMGDQAATNQLGVAAARGNAHHSLSMFDSELSENKVNPLMPLHHHVSQNAILVPQSHSQNYALGQMRSQEGCQQRQALSYKNIAKQARAPKRSSQNAEKRILHGTVIRENNFRTTQHQQSQSSKIKLTKN